jgi:hypothetical protein
MKTKYKVLISKIPIELLKEGLPIVQDSIYNSPVKYGHIVSANKITKIIVIELNGYRTIGFHNCFFRSYGIIECRKIGKAYGVLFKEVINDE